jgi:nucleotide-binding universal stress UspA family protein
VAASIADHAAELGADLIVLCAHGAGGLRGWLAGPMAQQVIRRAPPPVLLVRPRADGGAPDFAPRAVLVALDGGRAAARALPPALSLARALGTPLELAGVVPTPATLDPGRAPTATFKPAATTAALDLEADALASYLDGLAAAARFADLPARAWLRRGQPAVEIAALADRLGPVVLALATHGRGGLDAVWAGSVGARVVARVTGPLLLVHPD